MLAVTVSQFLFYMLNLIWLMHFKRAAKCLGGGGSQEQDAT